MIGTSKGQKLLIGPDASCSFAVAVEYFQADATTMHNNSSRRLAEFERNAQTLLSFLYSHEDLRMRRR